MNANAMILDKMVYLSSNISKSEMAPSYGQNRPRCEIKWYTILNFA